MARNRPSTIDRRPAEARDLIADRRANGATINDVIAELAARGITVKRSALGRHFQKLPGFVARSPAEHEMAALRAEMGQLREAIATPTAAITARQ